MSTPANRWKLGLFVLVASTLTLASTLFFGARSMRKETVEYKSYFDESVTGLDVGSPVKFRGVTIGGVSSIAIAADRRHVAVSYELGVTVLGSLGLARGKGQHTTLPAPPDLRVQLGSSGLTGVKYILIDFFDIRGNPAPVLPFPVPINCIPAAPSTMKSLEDSVVRAVDEFPKLATDISRVVEHVNQILTDVESQHLPTKISGVLNNADRTVALVNSKVNQVDANAISSSVQTAMDHLNQLTAQLQQIMVRFDGDRGVLTSVQRASDSVGDIAVSARGFGPELGETMRDLRETADSVRQLADALELDSDMLLKGRSKAALK